MDFKNNLQTGKLINYRRVFDVTVGTIKIIGLRADILIVLITEQIIGRYVHCIDIELRREGVENDNILAVRIDFISDFFAKTDNRRV